MLALMCIFTINSRTSLASSLDADALAELIVHRSNAADASSYRLNARAYPFSSSPRANNPFASSRILSAHARVVLASSFAVGRSAGRNDTNSTTRSTSVPAGAASGLAANGAPLSGTAIAHRSPGIMDMIAASIPGHTPTSRASPSTTTTPRPGAASHAKVTVSGRLDDGFASSPTVASRTTSFVCGRTAIHP